MMATRRAKAGKTGAGKSLHPGAELKKLGGSDLDAWNNVLANQTLNTLGLETLDPKKRKKQMKAAIAALKGIAPRDELEGMMAAQLVAAYTAAMECYRRAMLEDQTSEERSDNLAQAAKLSRSFALLLDALNRHRGKGQQKVTVEHVHVHSGGQAVVGVIEPAGGRGGGATKLKDQPHAKQIEHAPQPEMWGSDQSRNGLPITGDAERTVSSTRRPFARTTQGK